MKKQFKSLKIFLSKYRILVVTFSIVVSLCLIMFASKDSNPKFSDIAKEDNDGFKVLNGDCSRLYYDFLLNIAQDQFNIRKKIISKAYKNEEEVHKYQAEIKSKLADLINGFPPKTPLNAKTTGIIDCGDYRVEKIIFESRPGLYVTGNLYIPNKKRSSFPAILEACGHVEEGKAYEKYQKVAILLVKNGFVSFVIDTYSQGERDCINHTQIDIGAMLVGTDLVAYQAWDNIRAIDYLYSRPDVDKERIGMTGNSGGGAQTWYMMGLDPRIKVAAPSCGLQTRERMFTWNGLADGCHNFAKEGMKMLEYADYLISFAPRPVLILAAENDRYFDINAVARTVRETKWFYKELGALDHVSLFTVDDGHGFHQGLREAAVWWFKKWMMNDIGVVKEPEFTIQPKEKLWATKTGQILTSIKNSKSITDFNIQQAKDLEKDRILFWRNNSKQQCITKVKELINYQDKKDTCHIQWKYVGNVTKKGISIRKLNITARDGFPLPALVYIPTNRKNTLPVTVYLDSAGKRNVFNTDSVLEIMKKDNRIIVAVDLRGFGETFVNLGEMRKDLHEWNDQHAIAQTALYIGYPIMGQRAHDIIDVVDYLFSNPMINKQYIEFVGIGHYGPVLLHAAAIDQRIKSVKIVRSINSFMDIICKPTAKHQLQNVVPGAMKYYDLPFLEKAIAPRPIKIIEPVDSFGKPIPLTNL